MIELRDVHKEYETGNGVFGLSLSLSGGLTGFLGRNGSGKTTTMRLMTGLLCPDRGRILVDQRDLWQSDGIQTLGRSVGYLPHEDYFFDRLTGRENLEYLSLLKTRDRGSYTALNAFLRDLEVDAYLEGRFGTYSAGMKKKIQLIGAMIGEPRHLLLDEPHSGLDIAANLAVDSMLMKLRERGATILLSSHVADIFDSLADGLLIIDRGRIVARHDAPFTRRALDLYRSAIDHGYSVTGKET